jgi:hypothetical protein
MDDGDGSQGRSEGERRTVEEVRELDLARRRRRKLRRDRKTASRTGRGGEANGGGFESTRRL